MKSSKSTSNLNSQIFLSSSRLQMERHLGYTTGNPCVIFLRPIQKTVLPTVQWSLKDFANQTEDSDPGTRPLLDELTVSSDDVSNIVIALRSRRPIWSSLSDLLQFVTFRSVLWSRILPCPLCAEKFLIESSSHEASLERPEDRGDNLWPAFFDLSIMKSLTALFPWIAFESCDWPFQFLARYHLLGHRLDNLRMLDGFFDTLTRAMFCNHIFNETLESPQKCVRRLD